MNQYLSMVLFVFMVAGGAIFIQNPLRYSLHDSRRAPAGDLLNENYGQVDSQFVAELESFLRFLPASERKAWLRYIGGASRIDANASESIELQNLEFMKGPCFSDLAAEFYGWLMKRDVGRELKPENEKILAHRALGLTVSLADRAGRAPFADSPPGEVWKKALSIAGGEPNVAMAILGMCGHDDQVLVKPSMMEGRTATQKFVAEKKRLAMEFRTKATAKTKVLTDANELKQATLALYKYNWLGLAEGERKAYCPDLSLLYLPQSLGESVDLSDDLKMKIAKTQAPTKGVEVLPAKYYHVIGSAMRTCELKASAYTSFLSLISNPMLARLYRAKMMRDRIESSGPSDLHGKNPDRVTDSEIEAFLARYRTAYANRGERDSGSPSKAWLDFVSDEKNWIYGHLGAGAEEGLDVADVRRRLQRGFASIDAARLASRLYTRLDLPAVGVVYLPSRKRRAKLPSGECDIPEWSVDRCRRALNTLATWDVDFEWSQTQHSIGAVFALQKCRRLQAGETIESLACRALDQRPSVLAEPAEIVR